MLKHFIIRNLHSLLGFENYLFAFSIFKISTLTFDKRKREYNYFTTLFPENANIIVIGANTGITTIPIAKNIPGGKVFAIEPVPDNFTTLKRIIKYYKQRNVEAINYALGNETKEILMVMPIVNETKSHGLCHIEEEKIAGYKKGIEFKVQMKRLDDMFRTFEGKINGIKIVAENYERNIFLGAQELITKHRPVIYCELWFNDNRLKTLDLIKSWNYEIKVLEKKTLTHYNSEIHRIKNLFFIPRENSDK